MKALSLSALLMVLVASAGVALEKGPEYQGGGHGAGFAAVPAAVQYGGGWGGRGRASTAAEGAARGAADLVRAAGDANLRNSLAARNVEEARSRHLDNRLKYTETYFEMRQINQEQRAAEREKHRPDPAQLFRIREQKKPKRLASDQLNPVTGDIQWPSLLREDAFAEQRQQLEELFLKRASHDHLGSDDLAKVGEISTAMQDQLSGMIRDVSANDFMQARTFLKSLQNEARSQAG